jgi:parvulin-like peptidyl-prolyl isomerase
MNRMAAEADKRPRSLRWHPTDPLELVVGCCLMMMTGVAAAADSSPPAAAVAGPATKPAAVVNGADITEQRLADECLARHGAAVLDTLLNKRIIEQACAREEITVTPADIEAEIDAMSRRFNVPREQWIDLIQRERGVTAEQYRNEIVWPMIALRRLAKGSYEPTPEQIQRRFLNEFGPAVKARIIVQKTREAAEAVRRQALAAPEQFGGLARRESIDVGSASVSGWVQPIRRFSGDPQFEQVAFGLKDGEISPVLQVADQFIIIKCEGQLPASDTQLTEVERRIAEELREKQSRTLSGEVFRRIQDAAHVENILNNPAKQTALPEVAARVNGIPILVEEIRQACLDRHGPEVLEVLITRTLLEQALTTAKQTVSQADVDAEITRAAESMGFRKPDGSPDTAGWLDRVTREEKVPLRHYLEDVVQPTVALKKLVGGVPVSQEDLDRAYEATFGSRCRCRVIVLDNQRRAQEVWQLARENPSPQRFGELAEKYSVDPTSRALQGEVPPIPRHSGQPALEREAFSLKAGELSGVIQIADRFMVLFCEGFTPPAKVRLEEVRDELHADIFEKKQRIEMARYFTHLREGAAIDNFLAGTSQSPVRRSAARQGGTDLPRSTLTKREA